MDDLAFAIAQVIIALFILCYVVLSIYGPFQFSIIVVDSVYGSFPFPIPHSQDPETADLIRKLDIKKNVAVKGV